jgi:hypothetical protein
MTDGTGYDAIAANSAMRRLSMKQIRTKHVPAPALVPGLAASSFPSQPTLAEQPARRKFGLFRLLQTCSLLGAAIFAGASPSMAQAPQSPQDVAPAPVADASDSAAYATAVAYVVHFYPLWFTDQQWQVNNRLGTTNSMVAPSKVTPNFKFVVASNYDTLYSSAFLDLTAEPVVVTVPAAQVGYSILVLDSYGNQIPANFPSQTPGVFALTGPGFSGTLPPGITQIPMPINYPLLNFRAVKFSTAGQDQNSEAAAFIAALKTQPLSGYVNNPSHGPTIIVPESYFTKSFKTTADNLIARKPITFLKQLQAAVKAPMTPPLSSADQELSDDFDGLFGNGDNCPSGLGAGAQKAFALIINDYLTNTAETHWIHFTNIADWGSNVLDRAATTEYLQQSNGISTAAYYHTFSSGDGALLDGSNPDGYVLTFPAGQIPDAKLFWSLTAYTPDAIELIPNPANKYVVASYTPGLTYNGDGSVTVYMSTQPPANAPIGNWLPIPPGKFNIVLRVYGPAGDVANNTYVPPGIQRQ